MLPSNDLKEAWVVVRMEFADYEFSPDEEVRNNVLSGIHQLALRNNIDDIGNEYVEGSVACGGSANIYNWRFDGTLEDMAKFLQEVRMLTLDYAVGDEPDPMHGEYPEVLHEGEVMIMSNMVRFNLEMSKEEFDRIGDLGERVGLTRIEIFNEALTLLDWAIQEARTGRVIASVDPKNQTSKELLFPILEAYALVGRTERERQGNQQAD